MKTDRRYYREALSTTLFACAMVALATWMSDGRSLPRLTCVGSVASDQPPAPITPPGYAPCIIGTWEMTWGEVRCRAHLAANGDWACDWLNGRWEGRWQHYVDPKDGSAILSVEEGPEGFGGICSWRALLRPGGREGVLEPGSGGPFALKEVRSP
jgi:hypothetical protein